MSPSNNSWKNFCATGSEALRNASYAVASGAYDVAMAVGVEKVKDAGYQGLNAFPIPNDGTQRTLTAAAMFSLVIRAYANKYGVSDEDMRDALAHIAAKNHGNRDSAYPWNIPQTFTASRGVPNITMNDPFPAALGATSITATRSPPGPTRSSRSRRWRGSRTKKKKRSSAVTCCGCSR